MRIYPSFSLDDSDVVLSRISWLSVALSTPSVLFALLYFSSSAEFLYSSFHELNDSLSYTVPMISVGTFNESPLSGAVNWTTGLSLSSGSSGSSSVPGSSPGFSVVISSVFPSVFSSIFSVLFSPSPACTSFVTVISTSEKLLFLFLSQASRRMI